MAAVVFIGSSVLYDGHSVAVLAHGAFFLGVLATTLLLDLATHAPLRFVGPWEILVGLAFGAAGYLGLLTLTGPEPVTAGLHITVAIGALLAGHGGGHWTDLEQRTPRYLKAADTLRAILPLGSAMLTVAIGALLVSQPGIITGPARIGVALAVGSVAIAVLARQTLLLVDRERVIGSERRLSDELTVAEAQYRSVVERVPGVVYVAEAGQHGRWHFVSPKIKELLGYTAKEWVADPTLWITRMHPADRDRMIAAENDDLERTDPQGRWEYRLIARDGRVVWVIDDEAVISRDVDGRPIMVQGILVDITDRKDLEEQLRHQALHDPLTGLPNRVLFVDRLSHALVRRARATNGLAVLFADLDDFKDVNDGLGHAVGDRLLRLVAARLRGVLRAEDSACRLGGDEFAFLLEDSTSARAERVAERILAALGAPFELGDGTVTLSASIGIAVQSGPIDEADAIAAADELLRDADTAMYAAKAFGKGRVRLFDRGMSEQPAARRRELGSALARALDAEDELILEYQPIVDLRTRAQHGLEALVRWDHPQLGRLLPADFIPMAEENNLIRRLGDWVLRRACTDLAGGSTLVSVNVSAHQLGGGELSDGRGVGAGRDRTEALAPHARADREHDCLGRCRRRGRAAGHPAPRGAHRPRRLRLGLLLSRVPRPPADRHPQGRPLAGGAGPRRAAASRGAAGDRPHRGEARPEDDRRGRRARGPARCTPRARLPPRPGLPLLATGPAGGGAAPHRTVASLLGDYPAGSAVSGRAAATAAVASGASVFQ